MPRRAYCLTFCYSLWAFGFEILALGQNKPAVAVANSLLFLTLIQRRGIFFVPNPNPKQ